MVPETERHIAFAQRLRGLAALFVLLHHYLTFLCVKPSKVMGVINMPGTSPDDYTAMLLLLQARHALAPFALDFGKWGQFGVSLFFLLSGFVISFGLLRVQPAGFLIARGWRIWPTYVVGFASVLLMLAFAANIADLPFSLNGFSVLRHLLFIEDFVTGKTLDLVSWSLTIEILFYLLIASIAPIIRMAHMPKLFMFCLMLALLSFALVNLKTAFDADMLLLIGRDVRFIVYMFIGVVFSFHYRGLLSTKLLLLYAFILLALFLMGCYLAAPAEAASDIYNAISVYALLSFALFYALYEKITFLPRWIGTLFDHFSAISYPLYVIHVVHGYVIMNTLIGFKASPYLAVPAACIWVLLAALLLHRYVEEPTHRMGRRWSARYPLPAGQVREKQVARRRLPAA